MKPYAAFKAAIRAREGHGDYSVVNKYGFVGAYQFGMARLCDLGLTRRKFEGSKGFRNSLFEFIPPLTQEAFLAVPGLQDAVFDAHVMNLKPRCVNLGQLSNLSGAIAACHLLGVGGLVEFVRHNIDGVDAFGTKLSEYYDLFKGYEIP